MQNGSTTSKAGLWTGWIITILCTLFMLMDAVMKIIKEKHSLDGCAQIGWPVELIQPIGIILLICTILYIVPRTSILGAILLTGYLGGAVSVMARAQAYHHPYLFPVIIGVLVWAGLYFRDASLRRMIPIRRN